MFLVDAADRARRPADLEAAELLRAHDQARARGRQQGRQREARARRAPSSTRSAGRRRSRSRPTTGAGSGDLLDAIVWALPPESDAEIARKAREAEAERGPRTMAGGPLEPFASGDEDDAATPTRQTMATRRPTERGVDAEAAAGTRRWPRGRRAAGDRLRRPAQRRQVEPAQRAPGRGRGRSCPTSPGTTRDAIDTTIAWGRSEVVLIDTAGHPAARQGRVGPGRRALLDAPRAQGDRPRRRRGPRPRRGRRPDRPGRPRRGLRGRGGQGPRHRGQQVGPRRGQDRQDLRRVRRADPARGRRSSTSRRSSRSAPRPASGSDGARARRSTSGASAASGSRPASSTGSAAATDGSRRRSSRAAGRRSSTRRRPPSRRRRSCSSRRDAASVHFCYRRYLENRLRDAFGFAGTPIRLVFRERSAVSCRAARRRGARRRAGKGPRRGGAARARKPSCGRRADGRRGSPSSAPAPGARRWPPSSPSASRSRSCATPRRRRHGIRDDRRNEPRLPGVDLPAASAPTADPAALAEAPDLVIVAVPSAHVREGRARRRGRPRPRRGPPVGREGPRARHAPADERGHRRRRRPSIPPDRAPCPARTLPPRSPAGCRRPRSWRRGHRPRRARPGPARQPSVPALRQRRPARRGAVRRAQEHHRDRRRRGRRARLRRQRQGRAMTRGLAEMTRIGIAAGANPLTFAGLAGHRRRGRHLRVDAVAQPPARRRAGRGPQVGRDRGRRSPASPRAPTPSTRRWRWPSGSTSRCRSPGRSTSRCSRARTSGAAWSTCSPANRRTSSPTTAAGAARPARPGLARHRSSATVLDSPPVGAWRSLVAHLNGVQEAERSNRSAPTIDLNVKGPPGVVPERAFRFQAPLPLIAQGGGCAGPERSVLRARSHAAILEERRERSLRWGRRRYAARFRKEHGRVALDYLPGCDKGHRSGSFARAPLRENGRNLPAGAG